MEIDALDLIHRLYAIYEAVGDTKGLEKLRLAVEIAQWKD